MADPVQRKLRAREDADASVPAVALPESRKVRRVRKVTAPVGAAPTADAEPPSELPQVPLAPEPKADFEAPESFRCMMCGCILEAHTVECPICGERYLDLPRDALEALEKAEKDDSQVLDSLSGEGGCEAPCVLFDAEEGVIDFLEKDSKAFEVALICSECGTALEFATDKCPICGSDMDNPDAGLVGLVAEMTFDGDASEELDCPQCGERVMLEKGKCPECKVSIMRPDPKGRPQRLDPVIHGDNVIFLHLDVESGELNYLQRAMKKEGFEKMTIRLEGA